MAKKIYTSIDGIARNVVKIQTAENNIARKVIKAYYGIGDIARQFFASEPESPIVYNGTITSLANARYSMATASNSNYIFFAGGYDVTDEYSTVVEAYSTSSVRSTLTGLTTASAKNMGTGQVGVYAVFGGGDNKNTTVQAYNGAGTKSTTTALSTERFAPHCVTFNEKLHFIGGTKSYSGSNWNGSVGVMSIEAYNTSLTKTTPVSTLLSSVFGTAYYWDSLVASATSNYLIIGGGDKNDYTTGGDDVNDKLWDMYAFDTSYTSSTITSLPTTINPRNLDGVTMNGCAYIIDGASDPNYKYDANLVQTILTKPQYMSVSVKPFACNGYIVTGGETDDLADCLYTMDENGIYSICPILAQDIADRDIRYVAVGALGNRIYVAGGEHPDNIATDVVDVYDFI